MCFLSVTAKYALLVQMMMRVMEPIQSEYTILIIDCVMTLLSHIVCKEVRPYLALLFYSNSIV